MVCTRAEGPEADESVTLQPSVAIPSSAWARNYWARPPKRRKPLKPTFCQTLPLLPLGYRMWRHVRAAKREGREPFMDPFNDWQHDTSHGVPLGGIGCGAMGRGWRGGFRRYSTGKAPTGTVYITDDTPHSCFSICASKGKVPANGRVLLPRPARKRGAKDARYLTEEVRAESHSLFPRAWQVYDSPTKVNGDGPAFTATCEQLSPVIPHNYEDSSFPCCTFTWTIDNPNDEEIDVAIMFTLHNGTTAAQQKLGGGHHVEEDGDVKAVVMNHTLAGDPASFCIATEGQQDGTADACATWRADGFNALYDAFVANAGSLPAVPASSPKVATSRLSAVSRRVTVPANTSKSVSFALSWDFPIVRFGGGTDAYRLRYTKFFGDTGASAFHLARAALSRRERWREHIGSWQAPVLENPDLPNWYKAALFNEAYYLTAGGSVWTVDGGYDAPSPAEGDKAKKDLGPKRSADEPPDVAADDGFPERVKSDVLLLDADSLEKGHEDFLLTVATPVCPSSNGFEAHPMSPAPSEGGESPGVGASAVDQPVRLTPRYVSVNPLTEKPRAIFHEPYTPASNQSPGTQSEKDADIGHFLYLEGMEYRMHNTYDVHFYASFALAMLFPLLEKSLLLDVARCVTNEWTDRTVYLHSGDKGQRKPKHSVPHDLGGPTEEPWKKPNIYCIHDTSRWKDLPVKFVLMAYRDYLVLNRDVSFLKEVYPVALQVFEACCTHFGAKDTGMIVNDARPDQTYDAWCSEGVSAYCGGLWLAGLQVLAKIAEIVGDPDRAAACDCMFAKARRMYETLWNEGGGYYNYDSSTSRHSDSIQADQLCGEWYARACGLPSALPEGHAKRALGVVFEYNVVKFGRAAAARDRNKSFSRRGAINGMRPDGGPDTTSMQSVECWTGTTFGVAAHMILEGMATEAFETAGGVAAGTYEQFGFWFNTPEAWLEDGSFRSLGYMRPLSIWAMQWSLEKTAAEAAGHAHPTPSPSFVGRCDTTEQLTKT